MTTTVNGIDEIKALAGTDLGASDWKSVDQARIQTFADATDDHQWIHVDVDAAKDGPFGGPIAHGYLTLALVIPLWTELLVIEGIGMALNYGLNKVRFPAPVPAGSKIRLAATVAEVNEVGGGGVEVVADFTVECDATDKPACVAQAVYRYYP
ncbi:MAG: MaoC family dehydratase [Acidimicrobiales bacterium]